MSLAAPVNPDVPSSWMIPGVYVALDLTGSGAGLNNVQKRALLLAYKSSSGSKPANSPYQVTGQAQVNTYAGRGSDLARLFASYNAQIGGGQCDVSILPIDAPSSGTAATRLLKFIGTAGAQDAVNLVIAGYQVSVLIASGDTPTVIGANVATAINLVTDLPVTAGASNGTVTLTYRHKGIVGEDLPIIAEIPGTSGTTVSPGTITYATSATGSGVATVTIGGTTISAALSGGETAAAVATLVAAAINGGSYPVTCTDDSAGVLTLLYAPERVVRRPSAAIVTSTGTTATVACGTAGAGEPTLTTALAVVAALPAYACWVSAFNTTAPLGTLSTHIENYANGRDMKGQKLFAASCAPLATAGAVPAATSPALTASPRNHFGWCVDAPVQAFELAARHAARVCVEDFKPNNYDGEQLKSLTATVPLPLPHIISRPSPADQNSAMRSYYMTPYVVNSSNQLVILRSRTCSNSPDERLWDTALIDTADWTRYDYQVFLSTTFKGKSLKKSGVPRTSKTCTVEDIGDAVIGRMFAHEDIDFLDGADELKKAVRENINALSPSRVDIYIPFRPPVPLHIIAPTVGLV